MKPYLLMVSLVFGCEMSTTSVPASTHVADICDESLAAYNQSRIDSGFYLEDFYRQSIELRKIISSVETDAFIIIDNMYRMQGDKSWVSSYSGYANSNYASLNSASNIAWRMSTIAGNLQTSFSGAVVDTAARDCHTLVPKLGEFVFRYNGCSIKAHELSVYLNWVSSSLGDAGRQYTYVSNALDAARWREDDAQRFLDLEAAVKSIDLSKVSISEALKSLDTADQDSIKISSECLQEF